MNYFSLVYSMLFLLGILISTLSESSATSLNISAVGFFQIDDERESNYEEILSLLDESEQYHSDGKYDSAANMLSQALEMANSLNVDTIQAIVYSAKGNLFRVLEEWDSAISVYEKTLIIYQSKKNKLGQAKSFNHLGNIYLDKDEFTIALSHYQESIKLYEEGSMDQGMILRNISLIHFRLKDFDKALEYCQKALKISELNSDPKLKGAVFQMMGIIHKALGNTEVVLGYYEAAMVELESINDNRRVAQLLSSIGNLHFDKENFQTALDYYEKALKIQIHLGVKGDQCYTLTGIGTTYQELGDTKRAEAILLEVIPLAEETEQSLIVMDVLSDLSNLYASTGNYEKAYEYHTRFKIQSDSIYHAEELRQLKELETKYESERKEREIALLNAQNEVNQLTINKSKNFRNYLIAITLIMLILAFTLYSRYKIKVKANKKLSELDQFKTQFFTNVSHEFRTPLTLIIGPLDRLIQEEENKKNIQELKVMRKNAVRLQELINQILDLSKLDSGSLKLHVQKADINNFLKAQCHSFDSLAEQKKVEFKVDVEKEELSMKFDKDKIQKIMNNLLSNAFKFTPSGGRIDIAGYEENGYYIIVVKDSGLGIEESELSKIFDRFHQVNEQSDSQGSGIGLTLTKELVLLHQGKIEVKSQPGLGTTFEVCLPIQSKAYEQSEESSVILSRIADPGKEIDKIIYEEEEVKEGVPQMLVVDDNEDIRKYIRSIFESDFAILEAEDGKQGLEVAKASLPDMVISDVMMPKINGLVFSNNLKSDELTNHIPIILLTAKADFGSKLEGLQTGADDYLMKPFKEEELVLRVQNLLNQRKQLRERYSKMVFLEPTEISIDKPEEIFILKAQGIVEQNIPNFDFTVEQFQKEIGMSRMQLHRKLKAILNCSASEFIRDQRLQRAAQLLGNHGVNVSEAAYQSGFNNLSYFAKCFKEKFGKTPSQFS